MSSPRLFPPLRFATVEEGVYRGAYPTLRNMRFLRRLQLRTVVSLTPHSPSNDLEEWCEAEEAQLIHHTTVPVKGEPLALSATVVASVLSVLIDPSQLPCFVHCQDGVEATGIVVMCLRKLMLWSVPALSLEFGRYAVASGRNETVGWW